MVKKSAQPRKAKPKQSAPQPAKALQRQTRYQLAEEPRFLRMLTGSRTYQELYGEHPIKGKLVSALIVRGCRCFAFRTRELFSEFMELFTWIHGPYEPLLENEIRNLVNSWGASFVEQGLSFDEITPKLQELERRLRWKPKGRPVKRRPDAVTALELKLANPKLSWTNLARKACWCGEAQHDSHCTQRVRQEVMALKRVLRKYQITY